MKPDYSTSSIGKAAIGDLSVKKNVSPAYQQVFFLLLVIGLFASCKKNDSAPLDGDQLKDEIMAKTRDIYLWNTQIPSAFNTSSYAGPQELMTGIRQFSLEPGFSEPVDHYSFAIKKTDWDNVSTGVAADFGLSVFFMTEDDLRVRMVEPASPAGVAGIRRGWKILKINNNTNITSANSDFVVENMYNSSSSVVTFEKPDGSVADLTLTAATYQQKPVYLDTVYTVGLFKVGYLVLNSFLGQTSSVYNELAGVFARFSSENVEKVIVDLRYNGGGYVAIQQRLANYLVKSSANGSVMMHQEFNAIHSGDNTTAKFSKEGTLDINDVFFIVSDNTASASELLINNLKPYMTVKLVGEATYGKPVGFFDIQVGEWLIFPVSFRSTNADNEGNYFDGIQVDQEVADGLDKDWGNIEEARLASVLNYIGSGSFGYSSPVPGLNSSLESGIKMSNAKLNRSFKGAVMD